MGFSVVNRGNFSILECDQWRALGIRHGFLGREADFASTAALNSQSERFCKNFPASALCLLEQVHGAGIIDLRTAAAPKLLEQIANNPGRAITLGKADAIILPNNRELTGVAFGIRSADCAPILIYAEGALALMHAGWRGLAAGVIKNTLEALGPLNNVSVLIGPCAGPAHYEVGPEVITALGQGAVFRKGQPGKFLLDLAASAEYLVHQICPSAQCLQSAVCTINSAGYHSHRRDGVYAGRNLSFIAI